MCVNLIYAAAAHIAVIRLHKKVGKKRKVLQLK